MLLEGVRWPYVDVRNAVTISNVVVFLCLNSGAHWTKGMHDISLILSSSLCPFEGNK